MGQSRAEKKACEILPLTLFFLILQTGVIVLLAYDQISESRGLHGAEAMMEAVFPVSLAILIVLFCLYAFAKERQGMRLSTSVLELATLTKSVMANRSEERRVGKECRL